MHDKRSLEPTRTKIVTLLRSQDATVDELAKELQVTGNAIRSHLARLERDGIVHHAGVQRGVSKPAAIYGLTRESQHRFPKSDGILLRALLGVLADQLSDDQFSAIITAAGAASATEYPPALGTLAERILQATRLLDRLGGLAEAEECGSGWLVRSAGCPFSAVCDHHRETCQLTASLLSEYIRAPVEAHCEISQPEALPRCRFTISRSHADDAH